MLSELLVTECRQFIVLNEDLGAQFAPELTILCKDILEPVRSLFNLPIHVNSGFRCPSLNNYVGGVSNSQHCLARAVDFVIPTIPLAEVFTAILKSNIKYSQLIIECGAWLHCGSQDGFPPEKCMSAFTYNGNGIYTPVMLNSNGDIVKKN
jgi:hypothetical protein